MLISKNLFQRDLICNILGRVQDLNGGLVVENVALRRRQNLEYPVLKLLQLSPVVRTLYDQRVLFLFEFGTFSCHHDAEKLVFQTIWSYHEVQQRHLENISSNKLALISPDYCFLKTIMIRLKSTDKWSVIKRNE